MKRAQRLALKPQWAVQSTSTGDFLLSAEGDRRLIEGEAFRHVVPLMDGQHTQEEIVRALRGSLAVREVRAAIRSLEAEGLVAEPPAGPASEEAFWNLLGADPAQVGERRSRASAEVLATAGANAEGVIRALLSLEIRVKTGAGFRVVVADDYLNAGLDQLNRESWQRGQAWAIVKPYGRQVWLGPLFVPGRTPCWQCLAERLRVNGCTAGSSLAALPATTEAAGILMATEIAKWLLTGTNPALEGQICTVDMGSLAVQRHPVAWRPQCQVCGSHRKKSANLSEHVSPLTGIVTSCEKAGSWPGFSICTARGSQIWRPDFRRNLLLSNRMAVSGSGQSDAEAQARCLGEAIERYSLQFHGDEPRTTASYHEIQAEAIDPLALMQFSAAQYRRRKSLNRAWGGMDRVPEPFDPDQKIEWTAVQSLATGKTRYVPTAYCYLGYGELFCGADTNGCAAGTTWDEAVLRGLLELVERDAVGLWWYSRVRRPGFAWETLGSDRVRSMIELIRERGRIVHVLDLTTDIRIPAFAAISSRPDGSAMLLGAGASLDPEEAVRSAVSELAKILLNRELSGHHQATRLAAPRYFLQQSRAARTKALTYPRSNWRGLNHELKTCTDRIAAQGFEIYTLNVTRPEIALPVARVIVPGLRHWRPRFAPGRLYDAPAAMGWRPGKLKESELNPAPLLL